MAKFIATDFLQFCDTCGEPFDDPLSMVERVFLQRVSADRFGRLNAGCPIDFADFSEKVTPCDKSLDEIAEERALAIAYLGRQVILPISGGIDSTFILGKLLPVVEPERLTLVCHPSARISNPELFERLKNMGRDWEEVDDLRAYKDSIRDGFCVSGMGGDVLFGANCHRFAPEFYDKPWEEGLKYFFRMRGVYLSEENLQKIRGAFVDYAAFLGVPLEKFCEFAWLQNFGLNWTYTMAIERLSVGPDARDHMVNFFEAPEFSGWSLKRAEKLREGNPWQDAGLYKPEMKEAIKRDLGLDLAGQFKTFSHIPPTQIKSIKVENTDGVFSYSSPRPENLRALNSKVLKLYLKD
ncbi:hypothetical protein [Turicimonas muris]|uniref:hypothetical protein n=1 Tax=Turicimonas muris TaxID=1796652 RepID=UPI0023F3E466|nr:hypothetical protein [Turicimonas muris]